MIDNFRRFQVGPDPFDRTWDVMFEWQQNGISIRHADTVDVKFRLTAGPRSETKIIALPHPELLKLCKEMNRPLSDALCLKLAALHLRDMILTDGDMDKEIVTVSLPDLQKQAAALAGAVSAHP